MARPLPGTLCSWLLSAVSHSTVLPIRGGHIMSHKSAHPPETLNVTSFGITVFRDIASEGC